MSTENEQAVNVPLTDQLRSFKEGGWAEITERNGWKYGTNIWVLAHKAADELDRLAVRIRLLERDNLRLGAALFDALGQFDNAGDSRWSDIDRNNSMGVAIVEWPESPAAAREEKP